MARPDNQFDLDAQQEQEAEQRRRREEAEKRDLDDIAWLMGDKRGRRIMARIIERAGVFRTTFRPNSEMPFLEGMRNMGLIFYADVMDVAPNNYIVLLQEQKELKEHERSTS